MTVANKHDGSRILQLILKRGTKEERATVIKELGPSFVSLCKSAYGCFLASKMVLYGNKEDIAPLFYGHVKELIRNNFGSKVIDEFYMDHATPIQKTIIIEELYGPEFVVFKADHVRTISEVVKEKPELKQSIEKNLKNNIIEILNKDFTPSLCIVHDILDVFTKFVGVSGVLEHITTLSEHVAGFMHTQTGAQVAKKVVNYASPKDRKLIAKALKGFVVKAAMDQYGHLFIIRFLETTDDTTLSKKAIIEPLIQELDKVILDHFGWKVIARLLDKDAPIFGEKAKALLEPLSKEEMTELARARILNKKREERRQERVKQMEEERKAREEGKDVEKSKDADFDLEHIEVTDEELKGFSLSKKDPEVRRRELLTPLYPALVESIRQHATEYITSLTGIQIIIKTIKFGAPDVIAPMKSTIFDLYSNETLIENIHANKNMKELIKSGVSFQEKPTFGEELMEKLNIDNSDTEWRNNISKAGIVLAIFRSAKASGNEKLMNETKEILEKTEITSIKDELEGKERKKDKGTRTKRKQGKQ